MRWTSDAEAERARRGADSVTDPRAEEERLIDRARQGDQDAFTQLLRLHQRKVFSLIGNFVRQRADVEDLAQQVFLKVYRALGRFDRRAAFSTWLHRIVVNECYDYLRQQRALKSPSRSEVQMSEFADLDRLLPASPAPPDVARRTELRQVIERMFRRLPAADQLLLTLRELEGLSVAEIAGILKVKENTVKVRLFRARQRMVEIHRRILGQPRPTERREK